MKTRHTIYFGASQQLSAIKDASVDLVVTSPPYPMIEMWDDILSSQNPSIASALQQGRTADAFELMHQELDKVWDECYRVLKDGSFLCINIGDATRTINGEFQLYNSHSRIVAHCLGLGFTNLPNIIWHKATNAPNKFMGSGMLPCGAYVTLEHEYILIFRKGGKRLYKTEAMKQARRQSSFFWEERNIWFSDIWDLRGTKQKMNNSDSRERSAAYPLEIPYRLINMYSQAGDVVLDPFYGIGTTTQASMLLGRNSLGYEIDSMLKKSIEDNLGSFKVKDANRILKARYDKHLEFITEYVAKKGAVKHNNSYLNCGVITGQEEDLEMHYIQSVSKSNDAPLEYECLYEEKSDLTQYPKSSDTLF